MPIVSFVVRADSRPADGRGMVVAEFTWHDGRIEPAVFDAHSSEDLDQRLTTMIPQREAEQGETEFLDQQREIERGAI